MNNKAYQLIKDLPSSGIKAGNIYTLVNGMYVDDFGTQFTPQVVETSSDFFKEVSNSFPQMPPAQVQPQQPQQIIQQQFPQVMEQQPVQQPAQPVQQNTVCSSCQFPIIGNSKFCGNCGTPVGGQSIPQQQQYQWQPEPMDQFFTVGSDGTPRFIMWQNKPDFYALLAFGNVFRTQQECMTACEILRGMLLDLRKKMYPGQPRQIGQYPAGGQVMYQPQGTVQQPYDPYRAPYVPQQPTNDAQAYLRAQPQQPQQPPLAFRQVNQTLSYEEQGMKI